MSRWSCAVVLALLSCGSEEAIPEPAEFAELCGVAGPVRLIALEPDQIVRGRLELFEGRYFYSIAPRPANGEQIANSVAWSVGTCGEAPRRIAEDVRDTFTDPNWPGVLLACRDEAHDIVTLDPAGIDPPHVVFSDVRCRRRTDAAPGFVTLDGEEGEPASLIWHPYPEDPRSETSQPRVLLDPTSTPEYPLTMDARFGLAGDLVFITTSDGALLRVDPTDGAIVVEQTGVFDFQVSPDGRYLLYQDLASTDDDPQGLAGIIILRDRTTGEGATLAVSDLTLGANAFAHVELGFFRLTLRDWVQRIYFLPALDFIDLPQSLSLRWPLADGRWLLQQSPDGPIHVTDIRVAGSTAPLFGEGRLLGVQADAAIVLELPSSLRDTSSPRDEGGVWRVPVDGQPYVRLADRASGFSRLIDERRLLTRLDIDDDDLGDFVLVDLETREERLVDRRVPLYFWPWLLPEEDVVRYTVVDGERSGLWMARLPAP